MENAHGTDSHRANPAEMPTMANLIIEALEKEAGEIERDQGPRQPRTGASGLSLKHRIALKARQLWRSTTGLGA